MFSLGGMCERGYASTDWAIVVSPGHNEQCDFIGTIEVYPRKIHDKSNRIFSGLFYWRQSKRRICNGWM
ncbi:hypothetical protein SBF1_3410007 [Candidatus Desulfosporosinus infrequens]|uniref:Uncharacterized protein n=1 Tax=Candidatus Desulfosporosinus infrequens TaxID=2043169 RepID=A0A2U3L218_9FIRM|nr:hypothetical protein SBF1_3410007 [Candidatus Desulfosporosinus infrequens]